MSRFKCPVVIFESLWSFLVSLIVLFVIFLVDMKSF